MAGFVIGPCGVAPAASGWTPASVTTAFWYDASNAGSITQSGGTVSQWNDLSGNARHLTQATTTLQPTYTASALNSLPGLHFINNNSSTQDSNMQTATFTLAQPFTIVAVFKSGTGGPNNNTAGMSAFGVLVDGDLTQAAANRIIMFMGRSDLTNHASYFAGTASIDSTVLLAASTAYHYAAIFNGSSSSSDINGTTTSSQNPGTFGIVNGITIGPNFSGSGGTANGIDCYLCEMFCIPDTSNLANALTYVSAKWGV